MHVVEGRPMGSTNLIGLYSAALGWGNYSNLSFVRLRRVPVKNDRNLRHPGCKADPLDVLFIRYNSPQDI